MKLIDNWDQAHKFLSVQFALLLAAWELTPVAHQDAIMAWFGLPGGSGSVLSAFLAFAVVYGRLVKQQSVSGS